jgi:hypothetical protein
VDDAISSIGVLDKIFYTVTMKFSKVKIVLRPLQNTSSFENCGSLRRPSKES